jgi:hypothetical protein
MSKKYNRRHNTFIQAPRQLSAGDYTDSDNALNPNETLGPFQTRITTTQTWMGPDSTNAPKIGETDQEDNNQTEWPGLAERFLKGQINISRQAIFILVTLLWFGALSWLYINDNNIGRLNDAEGIKWFFIKSSFYSIIYILALIMIFISSFRGKKANKRQ